MKRRDQSVLACWWLPEEEAHFLDYVEKTGDVLAFPAEGAETMDKLVARPLRAYILREKPSAIVFGMDKYLTPELIHYTKVDEPKESFRVSVLESCVIEYTRATLEEGQLSVANLSFFTGYDTPRSEYITKPEGFLHWARNVFRWVRRTTSELHPQKGLRMTPAAMQALRQGLKLV
jgi:hypothetical protein